MNIFDLFFAIPVGIVLASLLSYFFLFKLIGAENKEQKKKFFVRILAVLFTVSVFIFSAFYYLQSSFVGVNVDASTRITAPALPRSYDNRGSFYTEDSRDYNQVSYQGELYSRDVSKDTLKVKGFLEVAKAYISTETESSQSYYASFSIPKTNFNTFKVSMSEAFPSYLYSISINTINRIGEKQSLETRQADLNYSQTALGKYKATQEASYKREIQTLNNKLASSRNSYNQFSVLSQSEQDPNNVAIYSNQMENLSKEIYSIESQIKQKNKEFNDFAVANKIQLNTNEQNISSVVDSQETLQSEVDIVSGNISIREISWWGSLEKRFPFLTSFTSLTSLFIGAFFLMFVLPILLAFRSIRNSS